MKRLLLVPFVAFFTLSLSNAQVFEGEWYGAFGPGMQLHLTVDQEKTGMQAHFDLSSDYENLYAFPIDSIMAKGDSLFFNLHIQRKTVQFRLAYSESADLLRGFYQMPPMESTFPIELSREQLKKRPHTKRQFESSTQIPEFDRQDSLRGSVTPERKWWDLTFYQLDVKVSIDERSISGTNIISYTVLESSDIMQIDLQEPMAIKKVMQEGKEQPFKREGNVYFIHLNKKQKKGQSKCLSIEFEGVPRAAKRAPWDGGFSWDNDGNRMPFVATSNQGLGASVWWPCKDHMYDEPDSMHISINVPEGLTAVSNGKFAGSEKEKDGTETFKWEVNNPISNYVVNVNIADYAHFSEVFKGEKGDLACDYYVLKENLGKAREHFKQVPMMLEAFEYWFGPYAFYEDGYKLVEVPYLGMEHQSSVTYGNHYRNGYLGRDLSGSGWGLKFDFIIIHESGHEWFANNITYKDIADMWIHESFTNYSESLYVEYHYGKDAGYEYERGIRQNILNDIPIIGIYDVNHEGSGDMYAKGSSMLHTIRQLVNDDQKWRSMLRGLNEEFYHSTVETREIEDYMIEFTGLDLQPVFDQYLRTIQIPTLEYSFSGEELTYRWINAVEGFAMPVKVYIDGKETWLRPQKAWSTQYIGGSPSTLLVDSNFYISSFNQRGEL